MRQGRLTTQDRTDELLFTEARTRVNGAWWVRVRLPFRPTGTVGWVPEAKLGDYQTVRTHLVINRTTLQASLFRSGKTVFRARIGVGKRSTPTPTGEFYIRTRLSNFGSRSVYGPLAFGTSARSANSIPHPYPTQQDGARTRANAIGGGIFVTDGAAATIRHSRLDGNAVTVDAPLGEPFGDAAALCSCSGLPLMLADSSISGNRLTVDVLSSADSGPSGPAALDSGGPTTIERTSIIGNAATVTSPKGDAGVLGAIGFFSGGTVRVTISHSAVAFNRVAAVAPAGAATIQGAGITNAGPLVLNDVQIRHNRGTATGLTGFAQGGGS